MGPDCFCEYYKTVPEFQTRVSSFFSDLILTNAHNEYLTKLINLGLLGLFSYLAVFAAGITEFLRGRKKCSLQGAFVLITGAYAVHNIFCYEQVCSTPFFVILIAIGNRIYCQFREGNIKA